MPGRRWQQNAGAALPDITAEVGEHLADADAALATPAAALELVSWALRRSEALDQVCARRDSDFLTEARVSSVGRIEVSIKTGCMLGMMVARAPGCCGCVVFQHKVRCIHSICVAC